MNVMLPPLPKTRIENILERIMIKRAFLTLSLLVFGMSCIAAEDAPKTYVAGTDYDVITPPVRAVDPVSYTHLTLPTKRIV